MFKKGMKKGLAIFTVLCLFITSSGITAFATEGPTLDPRLQAEKQIWYGEERNENLSDAALDADDSVADILAKSHPYYELDADGVTRLDETATSSSLVTAEEDDAVQIEKNVYPTGIENQFEIELKVMTTEKVETTVSPENAAVLLVMDMSGSMENDKNKVDITMGGIKKSVTKEEAAKYAAKNFIDAFMANSENSQRWISLIQFGTQAQTELDWTDLVSAGTSGAISSINSMTPGFSYPSEQSYTQYYYTGATTTCKDSRKHDHKVIDEQDDSKLKTVSYAKDSTEHTVKAYATRTATRNISKEADKATNIEGALRLANNVISAGKAKSIKDIERVYVILLTDGVPTAHVTDAQEGTDGARTDFMPGTNGGGTYTKYQDYKDIVDLVDFVYGSSKATVSRTGGDNIASSIKSKVTHFYSISFDQTSESMRLPDGSSGQDRSDNYSGVSTLSPNWLSTVSHTNIDVRSDIGLAFKNIADTITKLAKAWIVTDPMGHNISFVGAADGYGSPIPKVTPLSDQTTVEHVKYLKGDTENGSENSEGTLYWYLPSDPYKKETGSAGNKLYTYKLNYYVKLDTSASDFDPAELYLTNEKTTLSYLMLEETGDYGDLKTVDFKVPAVHGYLGEFSFFKTTAGGTKKIVETGVNANGEKATFELANADIGFEATAGIQNNGAEGLSVKFTGIPSGYDYTLTETEEPGNFEKDSNAYNVSIAYGEATCDLLESATLGGYFLDNEASDVTITVIKHWNGPKSEIPEDLDVTVFDANNPTENDTSKLVSADKPAVEPDDPYTWEFDSFEMPRLDVNGETISYTATEPGIQALLNAGWTPGSVLAEADGDGNWTIDVYNTYEDGVTTSVTAQKEWKAPAAMWDNNTASVTATLYVSGENGVYTQAVDADGAVVSPQTLNKANGWTYEFTNLPKRQAEAPWGEIAYVVSESAVTVGQGYDLTMLQLADPAGKDANYTLVNQIIQGETVLNGTKVWNDNGNAYGSRPDGIEIDIYENDGSVDGVFVTTVAISAPEGNPDSWAWSSPILPKYDLEQDAQGQVIGDGHEIEYFVKEADVDSELSGTEYDSSIDVDDSGLIIITNKLSMDKTFKVKKSWVIPEGENVPESITIELWRSSATETETSVAAVTLDAKTRDITDEEGNVVGTEYYWNDETTGNFGSFDLFDEFGGAYTYTIKEAVSGNYIGTITPADGIDYTAESFTFEIVNRNESKMDITGQKFWVDGDNENDTRPSSIQVQLLQDGDPYGDPKTVTKGEDGLWKFAFNNLPRFDGAHEYGYTIEELEVDGYTTVTSGSGNHFTITNTIEQVVRNVEGTKTWVDNSNAWSTRPNQITVILLADGKPVDRKQVSGSEDVWNFAFEGVDTYNLKTGKKIVYTAAEIPVWGYLPSWTGMDITNTLAQQFDVVAGAKAWVNDGKNVGNTRPDEITVQLIRTTMSPDGTVLATDNLETVTTKSKYFWLYGFEPKPVFGVMEDGTLTYSVKYAYSVKEVTDAAIVGDGNAAKLAKYTTTVNGRLITNTLKPEYTVIDGTKSWVAPLDLIPAEITISLMQSIGGSDPIVFDSVTLSKTDFEGMKNWAYTFGDTEKGQKQIPLRNTQGYPYQYTLVESSAAGFNGGEPAAPVGANFTNTIDQKPVTIEGVKRWGAVTGADRGVLDKEKTVVVELWRNDKADGPIATTAAISENNWSYTFTTDSDGNQLDMYNMAAGGDRFVYTVKEEGAAKNAYGEWEVVMNGTDRYRVFYGADAAGKLDGDVGAYDIYNEYGDVYRYIITWHYTTKDSSGKVTEAATTTTGIQYGSYEQTVSPSALSYTKYGGNTYTYLPLQNAPKEGYVILLEPGDPYTIDLYYERTTSSSTHYTPPPKGGGTTIPEIETPLADTPVIKENPVVLVDPEVPLADIPQTGVEDMSFNLMMLGISLSALLAMLFARKRTVKAADKPFEK